MFYVIHIIEKNDWIWIKKKSDAVRAAQILSNHYDVNLQSSDCSGNYKDVLFKVDFQLSLFDFCFDDLFEKYIYHDGSYDFYAYKLKS